ncbi:hypothetical protein B0H17DRAFT_1217276 [Mycena rosella]|uniref:Uncharacterized protein n=1 Tax=Mycena rosella TaxID=1033263 RepID=A0AAD7C0C5_MYCRO|nr:hypothetical protein B0H17DRAFT_1217276 [Mycena rosella]
MFTTTTTHLVLTLVAAASVAKADFFANFFDDAGCTQNGGIGVDIRNPDCLGEAGRGSVLDPSDQSYRFVGGACGPNNC